MVEKMTNKAKPVFLLAGGRGGKKQDTLLQAVYKEFGLTAPTIAYSGTASGDDKRFFGYISGELTAAGADKITHAVIAAKGADLTKARKILEAADIIFVSGGDVEAGMEVLKAKDMVGVFQRPLPPGQTLLRDFRGRDHAGGQVGALARPR
jgi:hypothetical protein